MVGALNVGSMATVWAGDITPAARRVVTHVPGPALTLEKGAELGRFNMGSTVILLFEPGRARWHPLLRAGSVVQLGRTIGWGQPQGGAQALRRWHDPGIERPIMSNGNETRGGNRWLGTTAATTAPAAIATAAITAAAAATTATTAATAATATGATPTAARLAADGNAGCSAPPRRHARAGSRILRGAKRARGRDPHLERGRGERSAIESLATRIVGVTSALYMSTSPEYPMKRLLAAGSGDIYQVCKVFRDGERGRWHNPEFTMLEWYRLGYDDDALMTEVEELVASLLAPYRQPCTAERLTYAQALRRHAGVDAHTDSEAALAHAAAERGIDCRAELDRDGKLDLLMSLVVGPKLGRDRPCFIHDYPASQASLARLKPGLPRVAARFELYLDGIELANGFDELVHGGEQHARFTQDLATRRLRGQILPPLDERLLAALASGGMPDCAGVALGFDRLVAIALGAARLPEAMAFSIDNA